MPACLGLAPRLRVRKHVPRPAHCCVFVFILVAGAVAITHNASPQEVWVQLKGQDVQAGIALACKCNAPWGREGDSGYAGALQRAVPLPLLVLLGMGRLTWSGARTRMARFRHVARTRHAPARTSSMDGLGLCGPREEGKACERRERCVRGAAELGEHGRV